MVATAHDRQLGIVLWQAEHLEAKMKYPDMQLVQEIDVHVKQLVGQSMHAWLVVL